MTQPDPWSAQAQGQPTQPFGPHQTAPLPASTQAYGDAYSPYNSFDEYSSQQGPPAGPPPPAPPPRKNTGLIVAIAACGLLLVAVAGLAIVLLNRDDDSSSSAAGSTSNRAPASASARFPTLNIPTQVMPRNPQSPVPGLPDIGSNGSAVGTISRIDGSTLEVKTLMEDSVKVKTDDKTKVISLTGAKVSDLKVGDMIMVQGDKDSDGSIRAGTIISMSLGDK